jgi:hypothetical protein
LARRELGRYPTLRLNISVDGVIDNPVTDVATLKSLLEGGNKAVLCADVDIRNQSITIPENKESVLDLNGHTVTAQNTSDGRITIKGKLTVKDSSNGSGRIVGEGESGNTGLLWAGDPSNVMKYGKASVVLEGGVIDATCKGGYGVVVRGGSTFEMTGGSINAYHFALSGNGNDNVANGASKGTFTISGGHLESLTDYAIYLPHYNGTTIKGNTEIVGEGGIDIQRGLLKVEENVSILAKGTVEGNVPATGDGTRGLYWAAICTSARYDTVYAIVNNVNITSKGFANDLSKLYNGNEVANNKTIIVNGGKFSDLTFLPYFKTGSTEKITLNKNLLDVSEVAFIDGDVTLDLNGYMITAAETVTTSLTSKDTLFGVRRGAKFTVNATGGGSIKANHTVVRTGIKLTEANDEDRDGYSTKDAELVVNGGTIEAYSFAISGNGLRHGTKATINGGTFKSTNPAGGTAFYHPQKGTLEINGGTFTGYESGLELRSGTLNINGGTFSATATQFSSAANGNGTTTVGAGVSIVQHETKRTIEVTIKGGTFKTAASEGYALYNDKLPNDDDVTISVQGGNFEQAIYSIKSGFITGGNFKVSPVEGYIASGYSVSSTVNSNGYYTISANK